MKNSFLEQACKATLIFCRQHKSTILSCISAVGVVATGVLSARGGIKAEKILSARKKDISISEPSLYEGWPTVDDAIIEAYKKRHPHTELSDEAIVAKCVKQAANMDAAKRLIPALLPPLLTAAGTIALIFVNDAQNREAQAALAGAYALMAKKLADYKAEVKDIFGEEADRKVEESIAQKRLADNDIFAEERADDAKLWYDSFSERWFWATDAEVSDAEYYANRIFCMQGCLTLNEFYALLPLDAVPCGDEIGWDQYVGEVCYGYTWIDFAHIDHNEADPNRSYKELYFPFTPHPFFEEEIEMEKEYQEICATTRKESPNEV